MDKRGWLASALLGASFAAWAGTDFDALRRQVESSTVVTGTIDVEEDGRVSAFALDHPEKLSQGVTAVVERNAPRWRFEPVKRDGHPVKARAKMSLQLVARPVDTDHYAVEIEAANFGEDGDQAGVRSRKMAPPTYPHDALYAGAFGTVYLVLQIDRAGEVADVVPEQINLKVLGTDKQMVHWRDDLADASIRAARHWRFEVPTSGPEADRQFWSVRVPVAYHLATHPAGYGEWETYLPGPVQKAPWIQDAESTGPGALAAGGVYEVGKGLRLLTPLDQG